MEREKLMLPKAVADRLKMTTQYVYQLVKLGRLRCAREFGRILILEESVVEYERLRAHFPGGIHQGRLLR